MSYDCLVDVLIGRYEAGLVRERTHSHRTLKWICEAIEGFFEDHPKMKRPEQVLITDVEDWRAMRLARGDAWNVIRRDLGALKAFYNWLRREEPEYSGLDNPVYVPRPRAKGALNESM